MEREERREVEHSRIEPSSREGPSMVQKHTIADE